MSVIDWTKRRGQGGITGDVWIAPIRGTAPASAPMPLVWSVQAEFAGAGNGWTDITTDLTDTVMRTQRGFQSSQPWDLTAAPGAWTFTLDNSVHNSGGVLGYYSPDSASKRTGWATGIRMRLQSTVNGNVRTKFVGWLESITPLAGVYADQTVDCMVAGWLNQAMTTSVTPLGVAANKRGHELVAILVALASNQPAATSYGTGIDLYPYAFDNLDPANSSAYDGLDAVDRSGFDRTFEKADGTIRFETRQTRQTYTLPVLTITDTAPGGQPGLAVVAAPTTRTRAQQINRFQVTVHPKRVDAGPVVLYSLPISATEPAIAPGQSVTMQLPYVDPSQLAQHVGGFNMLVSDGLGGSAIGTTGTLPLADYQFTSAAAGGGLDISASMTVTVVFGNTQATVTITNGSTFSAYRARLQVRGQGIYDYQTVIGTATAAGSIGAVGQNSAAIDASYNADPFFATSAATYCATLYSRNVTQLDQGIQIFVHADDTTTMDALLQREISDAIAVSETVAGLVAGSYWINGEIMEIDERGNVLFTYPLAPNLSGVVWTIGVAGASELGVTTVLGF